MDINLLLKNYKANAKKIWNFRAKSIYDRWKDETGDFAYIKTVLDALSPSSLIDIGFGYGRLSPIYQQIPNVVGMDISQCMLRLFAQHYKGNKTIRTLLGDIRSMPFQNLSFECLVSIRTLNHIHPSDFTLVGKEISRVSSKAVILLESDVKVPSVEYEFEHDYNLFLNEHFKQEKMQIEEHIYLRKYLRRTVS